MHPLIIPILAILATVVTGVLAGAWWLRLKRSVDSGTITVVNKQTGKTAVLPRNYSLAAVEELLNITA